MMRQEWLEKARIGPERWEPARVAAGIGRTRAAGMLGMSRQQMRWVELGRREPRPSTYRKAASMYGVPVDFLMGRLTGRRWPPWAKDVATPPGSAQDVSKPDRPPESSEPACVVPGASQEPT